MQLGEWELIRASRIVLILLVVQHLGLSQLLVVAPATGGDPAPSAWTAVPTDALVSPALVLDPHAGVRAPVGDVGVRTIPPDPSPLSRRLTRAPPTS